MPHILIIEDEEILRRLISEELQIHDKYKVSTAVDGVDGWEKIRALKPSIILLDLLMPRMDGYEVLTLLRANPEVADIPCIVISNSGQVDDLNRAYSSGADDVLIKADFNPDQLSGKIDALLHGRAQKKKEAATKLA